MPKLKEVVTSLIESLEFAQHQSNLRTRELAEQYKNDKNLGFLTLPNAVMSEVNFTLRYMFTEESAQLKFAPKTMAKENPAAVDEPAMNAVATFTPSRYATKNISKDIVAKIQTDENLRTLVSSENEKQYLTNRVNIALQESISKKQDGKIDMGSIKDVIYASAAEKYGTTKNAQFSEEKLNSLLGELESSVNQQVATVSSVPDAFGDISDLDVIVDGNLLVNESAIQVMQIKAKMENYRWVVSANDEEGHFVIVE